MSLQTSTRGLRAALCCLLFLAVAATAAQIPVLAEDGLRGEYFDAAGLPDPEAVADDVRIDPSVDFRW